MSAWLKSARMCEDRADEAMEQALNCQIGGQGSMEWIAEASHYAAVAAALRARAALDRAPDDA